MTTAIYARVSSNTQDTRAQEVDLKRWAADQPVTWYRDKFTGRTMERPGMTRLLADIRSGKVTRVVCWRLDRLGRTARGLHDLIGELVERKVGFVSLREGVDLGTPAGRMMVGVLASIAQFETEVRSERQRAGIEAAKEANGGKVPWGGRRPGVRVKLTQEKEAHIKAMFKDGKTVAEIARVTELGRQTVYRCLNLWQRKPAE